MHSEMILTVEKHGGGIIEMYWGLFNSKKYVGSDFYYRNALRRMIFVLTVYVTFVIAGRT